MPDYKVRVTYVYPVSAVNAEDAFSTLEIATKLRYPNGEGKAEVINTEGEVVLTAELVTKPKVKTPA